MTRPLHRSSHRESRLASKPDWLLLLLLAILAASPVLAHDPSCCESCAPAATKGTATTQFDDAPLDLPAYRERLEAYYYSGRYEEDIAAVVTEARAYLAQRIEEGVEKPAMVLDIDETSLSNWAEMKSLQFGYDRILWREWVETASAYAIGPTLELARWAEGEGVELFFITGRDEVERAATEKNLTDVGYPPWNTLYLEDESQCCTGESCSLAATCKSFYRKKIADQGYTIVINVGDQRSDLLGGWSERTFKLPNPFYFVP